MKMIVTNKRIKEQYALEIPLADGQVIRETIQPGDTIEIVDINPWDINTYKILRNEVFVDKDLDVCFESEPDDLPCLFNFGRILVQDGGIDLGQFFDTVNFIGAAVTATPSAIPGTADITIDAVGSTALEVGDFKEYVGLTGLQNDSNLVFTIPDKAIHSPPGFQLKVYRNGVRLNPGVGNDYTVSESGGAGTGFDTITFTTGTAPRSYECLWADYTLFGAGT